MKYSLGINLDVGFADPWEDCLSAAKNAGFEAFFVTWRRPLAESIRKLSRFAESENMIFQSLHAPFERINKLWREDEETQDVIDEQIECIKACDELKIPLMIIHPYIGFDSIPPTDVGIRNFRVIVEAAREYGIRLAFENVEGEPYLEKIIRELGDAPHVGFCWDIGHEQCYNGGTDVVSKYANGKLFGTHCNDNLGVTEPPEITWLDDAHMLPYDGIVNWKGVVERLEKAGFAEKILMFELIRGNRPDRHTHDAYRDLTLQQYMCLAFERAKRVSEEKL